MNLTSANFLNKLIKKTPMELQHSYNITVVDSECLFELLDDYKLHKEVIDDFIQDLNIPDNKRFNIGLGIGAFLVYLFIFYNVIGMIFLV